MTVEPCCCVIEIDCSSAENIRLMTDSMNLVIPLTSRDDSREITVLDARGIDTHPSLPKPIGSR